jgi:serine/threonine-protein kinase RsbT
MMTTRHESKEIKTSADIVLVTQAVRAWTVELKFGLVDQTKLITAASELARNTLEHGGGGSMTMEMVTNGTRSGVKLTFEDSGPGIPDIEKALTDGYTTKNGMGLGLSGSKKLVNDFEIASKVGEGTKVTVIRWK